MSCSSSNPTTYCSAASTELKLYQAFIFSVPVFFTFILLLLFYLFYLRRRRANWQSLRMRANHLARGDVQRPSESGLKKEVREMLPVVVFKESFLIRETQCSVCLGEYQKEERLQRIPPCGHTFHVDCIDHWLSNNTTCPLCRVSLVPTPTKTPNNPNNTLDLESQSPPVLVQAEQEGRNGNDNDSDNNINNNTSNDDGEESRAGVECKESVFCGESSVIVDLEARFNDNA